MKRLILAVLALFALSLFAPVSEAANASVIPGRSTTLIGAARVIKRHHHRKHRRHHHVRHLIRRKI